VRDEATVTHEVRGDEVSEAEYALLEERARGAGMRLAEWVREALLSAPVNSGPDSGEVALGEVLALRSLLLNLHGMQVQRQRRDAESGLDSFGARYYASSMGRFMSPACPSLTQ
jgi:hypothetical protein